MGNILSVPLPSLLPRKEYLDHKNLPPKLLALNNWLLDGKLPSGGKPDYQPHKKDWVARGNYFKADQLKQDTGTPNDATMNEVTRSALALVDDQVFIDGNTRTSVLVILEYLATLGSLYTRDPVRIYWILAQRHSSGRYDPAKIQQDLIKEVRGSLFRPPGGVTSAKRVEYTQKVKDAQKLWDKIEDIHRRITAAPTVQKKREIAREEKRKNPYVYERYRERYPNDVNMAEDGDVEDEM
ncbi:hypothetical protein BDV25DRAFT_44734 [Aspergillus avenaceus]|uniref:Uncharacterized protein n=1 Tax=Aspergillus avenaceus TaxID=36643 RepID=A0A5N6U2Z2_ASPAV|nr:hypothetical protein BDV25DRAFT_44734 [Aspergillus avenaceus]